MTRMLGKLHPPFCIVCRAESGPDCADKSKDKRHARRLENRLVKREVNEELLLLRLDSNQ